jgi:hypothetical protein
MFLMLSGIQLVSDNDLRNLDWPNLSGGQVESLLGWMIWSWIDGRMLVKPILSDF